MVEQLDRPLLEAAMGGRAQGCAYEPRRRLISGTMTKARIGPLLAATVAAAVLFYGASGHSLPQGSHDGMAGAAVGLCLLFVMTLALSVPGPQRHEAPVAAERVEAYVGPSPAPPLDGRARASPSVLQRFRN